MLLNQYSLILSTSVFLAPNILKQISLRKKELNHLRRSYVTTNRIGGIHMALIIKSQKMRLMAKTKYDDNGTIKSATRNLTIGGVVDEGYLADTDAAEQLVKNFQKVTTDTVVSFYAEQTVEYEEQSSTFGTPGTIAAGWEDFEDVKLINYYTNGTDNAKYTVTRAATGATDAQLRAFGVSQAAASNHVGDYNAVNGEFTGATVTSAWTNS